MSLQNVAYVLPFAAMNNVIAELIFRGTTVKRPKEMIVEVSNETQTFFVVFALDDDDKQKFQTEKAKVDGVTFYDPNVPGAMEELAAHVDEVNLPLKD